MERSKSMYQKDREGVTRSLCRVCVEAKPRQACNSQRSPEDWLGILQGQGIAEWSGKWYGEKARTQSGTMVRS